MAIWTDTIGAPFRSDANRVHWGSPGASSPLSELIPSSLVFGGGIAYLRTLLLFDTGVQHVRLLTSVTSDGLVGTSEDLVSGWEGLSSAVTISAGSLSLSLPGPSHPSNQSSDATEPYLWVPSTAKITEIETFITDYNALTAAQKAATTLTLRDELPPDLMPTFGTGDIANQTYTQNTAITALQLPSATGGDGTLAYSITGQPAGVTLNASRQLVGTPTATGTFNVTFTVTDADGDTDTISFTITVNAADLMPSLPAIADQTATVGTAFSLTFSAATSGDPPLAYSVSGEPSWMSINNRTLSGTPDATGTHTVTVTVTDDDGDTDTASFDIVVSAALAVITIDSVADQTGEVVRALVTIDSGGNWYNHRGGNTDGSISSDSDLDIDDDTAFDRLRYQATSDRLLFNLSPANAQTIFGSGGVGENAVVDISTPYGDVSTSALTVGGGGNIRLAVTTADETIFNQLQDDDLVNLVVSGFVAADLIPDFGSGDIADQTYTQNTAISALQLPAATGGDGTLVYSITGEPSGLTLNNSRQLVGTPTATGTFSTTFTVTDDDGDTDTIDFTITVNAADLMPDFGSETIADRAYTQNVAISTPQLPEATGGDGTLSYSISGEPHGHYVKFFTAISWYPYCCGRVQYHIYRNRYRWRY